jgi:predicted DsbA family dithiol-disulfide isomerase
VRLRRIEEEFGDAVQVEWRSYLLRPSPVGRRDLERFRSYTQSWLRPAAEQDSGVFQPWQTDVGPPTHSVPPHQVAKAAAELGEGAFRRIHERLLRAYFTENQDITDSETLARLWLEVGLPQQEFARREDPALLRRILDEHRKALDGGATGVPAVSVQGNDIIIVGAYPVEFYQRWVNHTLATRSREADAPS